MRSNFLVWHFQHGSNLETPRTNGQSLVIPVKETVQPLLIFLVIFSFQKYWNLSNNKDIFYLLRDVWAENLTSCV